MASSTRPAGAGSEPPAADVRADGQDDLAPCHKLPLCRRGPSDDADRGGLDPHTPTRKKAPLAQDARKGGVPMRPTSLWQKSGLDSTDQTACSTLQGMAMGKRPAARQAPPMWVNTEDLPTSDGHPFFERLNRVLEEIGFDVFVEELCSAFYAERLGRPSLRPGRYFRLLFIGFFEGLSSERGIVGGGFAESAIVSGAGPDGSGAGPLDDVADATAD